MAGSLVQVSRATGTGSNAALTVTGISSSDIYVVFYSVRPVDNDKDLYVRVTTGGTADSDSQYDMTGVFMRADASFSTSDVQDSDKWFFNSAMPNDSNKWSNNSMFLFNFNNSSEYSYVTLDSVGWNDTIQSVGDKGAGIHTVNEANDGINLTWESGSNFASGSELILYRVV